MPKGRPKKGGRVVETNIKVTKEVHSELQEATNLLRKSQSEVISMALKLLMPELSKIKQQREEFERAVEERVKNASQN